ncbi:hypothetical protein FIA58_001180 [Flavobacterium jejuense]|uniref:DUF4595 domain-containing protein n=1 Tax=Flavobacterium jejuense TaxID=1544455 RepID=A0ABX0IL12_9FLAO|nr:hypothetical protein [Flavobacterium jejuense]NHN24273.1 hypothetical protein [Flavobacterium jejuense]
MKKNISTLLFVSIFSLISCSKDDDGTVQQETLGNAKKVILNTYSEQGNITTTTLYEFSYNENNLLSAMKISNVDGVKNRTINYNADKKVSQITQTFNNVTKILTVAYNGENATVSISGQNEPYGLTYNTTNGTYNYSNGTDSGTLTYGENQNLIGISSNNISVFSKNIVPSIKGIYANQDKLFAFISSFLSNGDFLFFDRNAASTLFFNNENYSITNESEKGSLTYYAMINTNTQVKIADVIIIY